MIPTRKITRVVMDASTPIESNERLYRIRGTHVQWDGTGSPPELIAAYQKARGELPSFITLPLGRIQFQMDGYVATWSGTGAIPDDVLHYLDEYQTLPPMVGKKSRAA
jgi:DNA-binding protein H-NS